jgi:5'-3' exonuclease
VRTALIDGDSFIYSAASAHEYECEWDHDLWTLHAHLSEAIAHFDRSIEALQEQAQADAVVVALTDGQNWRKDVMPSYKSHRAKTRKPLIYRPMREYCAEKYNTFQRPMLEGDDVLGILATAKITWLKGERVIVSIDKDLQTIPGTHLRLDTGTLRVISVEEADRFHLLQTLAGDASDGYPGCPGVGMTTGAKLLDDGLVLVPRTKVISRGPRKGEQEIEWVPEIPGTPWEVVVSAFQRAGLTEDVALMNARVARICRASDYNFETREVRLWTPK